MHDRQAQTVSHALVEITTVVREREVLEEKLTRVRETSVKQTQRSVAEEEEVEREKQVLAKRMRALEEESARLKAAALKEAERRMEEQDEILLEKQKLEEALARVQAHSFRSVFSSTSPRTKESSMTTPISGVVATAPSFASLLLTPAICSPGGAVRDLSPAGSAQTGLSLCFQRALSHASLILA